MIRRVLGVGVLVLWIPLTTLGAEAQGLIAPRAAEQTEAWLQLQREGNAASRRSQQATPAERELAMQRWLDSFKHPIPAQFEQDIGGDISR